MPRARSLLTLIAALCISGCQGAIGGADYAPQYDFSEFFAATDGRTFRVIVSGNPFPALSTAEFDRRLLPVMQANRPPRPRLTFTYDVPAEKPRPDYRLVGRFYVFAVYCRNELALSQTTASTLASGPEDQRVGQLLGQLFLVLFPDFPLFWNSRRPFLMH